MKVTVVYTQDWDSFSIEGIFSTPEKAQAYIDMVAEAEKAARVPTGVRQDFEKQEYDVDELDSLFPVFAIASGDRRGPGAPIPRDSRSRVLYLAEVPQTHVWRREDGFAYAIEVYATSPAEAKTKMAAAKVEYFTD